MKMNLMEHIFIPLYTKKEIIKMTVSELIKKLQEYPMDYNVFVVVDVCQEETDCEIQGIRSCEDRKYIDLICEEI